MRSHDYDNNDLIYLMYLILFLSRNWLLYHNFILSTFTYLITDIYLIISIYVMNVIIMRKSQT